jgi:hypothetical protein
MYPVCTLWPANAPVQRGQDALTRHVVVVDDPIGLAGLAVGDAGLVPFFN